jgi:hypothetical protein
VAILWIACNHFILSEFFFSHPPIPDFLTFVLRAPFRATFAYLDLLLCYAQLDLLLCVRCTVVPRTHNWSGRGEHNGVGPSLKLLTILGDRRSQVCVPSEVGVPCVSCYGRSIPSVTVASSENSLGNSRSDFGADWELTRRIDSSPASVCAPTVSVGRCALGFSFGEAAVFMPELKPSLLPYLYLRCFVSSRMYTEGRWASYPRTCTPVVFILRGVIICHQCQSALLVSSFILFV